jgi:hypothetical protein
MTTLHKSKRVLFCLYEEIGMHALLFFFRLEFSGRHVALGDAIYAILEAISLELTRNGAKSTRYTPEPMTYC